MQRVCGHVIHTHAYNASHLEFLKNDWPCSNIPCKAGMAGGAVGCAGKYGTAEPKSLRGWQCSQRSFAGMMDLNQRNNCTISVSFVGSCGVWNMWKRTRAGCRFALPGLRDPSSFRGTRDGDTRHGRGWDAKLTVCCPSVQGFDDRRIRMHNALRAGEEFSTATRCCLPVLPLM
jgi:hypothetical protein